MGSVDVRAALWLTFLALALLPRPAAAQDGDALGPIREMVLYSRYEEAIAALAEFLEDETLAARPRNEALELLAVAQLANRDGRAAQGTLETLYSRDPTHRLSDPDASPVVQGAFARAREAAPPAVAVRIDHLPPDAAGGVVQAEFDLDGAADAVHELRVSYRDGSDGSFQRTSVTPTGRVASVRVPRLRAEAHRIEYYAEALAPSGAVLATLGTTVEPLELALPSAAGGSSTVLVGSAGASGDADTDEGGSVFGEWWLWTLVGVVVAGGVAAYLLLRPSSQDGFTDGSLGTVMLE
jgi:hypothetical protein